MGIGAVGSQAGFGNKDGRDRRRLHFRRNSFGFASQFHCFALSGAADGTRGHGGLLWDAHNVAREKLKTNCPDRKTEVNCNAVSEKRFLELL